MPASRHVSVPSSPMISRARETLTRGGRISGGQARWGDPRRTSQEFRTAGVDRPVRRPISAARGFRHTRSGSSVRWSLGPATSCGVGCPSDPPP
jgi:hypothetical protein